MAKIFCRTALTVNDKNLQKILLERLALTPSPW
jgi:hypothetical protein